MFGKLLAIFIGIPFIEMLILIKLGEVMGFGATVMLIIVTGFLGAAAARAQGMRAWLSIQSELAANRMPGEQMLDALLIFVAGLVLITPGLLTDLLGFTLLIPVTRSWIKRWMRRKIEDAMRRPHGTSGSNGVRIFIE